MEQESPKEENSSLNENQTEKDWFLQLITNFANNSNNEGLLIEFPVTLVSHGMLISGNIISGKQYFNIIGDEISSALGKNEAVKEGFAALGKKVYETLPQSSNPSFIHLRNAHFYDVNGSRTPTTQGVIWRGRISEVSGFNFGTISVQS